MSNLNMAASTCHVAESAETRGYGGRREICEGNSFEIFGRQWGGSASLGVSLYGRRRDSVSCVGIPQGLVCRIICTNKTEGIEFEGIQLGNNRLK